MCGSTVFGGTERLLIMGGLRSFACLRQIDSGWQFGVSVRVGFTGATGAATSPDDAISAEEYHGWPAIWRCDSAAVRIAICGRRGVHLDSAEVNRRQRLPGVLRELWFLRDSR